MKLLFITVLIIVSLIIIWHLLTKKYLNPYTLTIIFGKKGCGKSTLLQKLAVYYKKRGYYVYCNLGDSDIKECTQIPIQDLPYLAEAGHAIEHYKDYSIYENYIEMYNERLKTQKNKFGTGIYIRRLNEGGKTNETQQQTVKRAGSKTSETSQLHVSSVSQSNSLDNVPLPIKSPAVILCDEINLLWDNRNFKNFSPDLQRYFRLQRHYHHIFYGFSQTYDCDLKIKNLADSLAICSRVGRVWIRTKSYVKKVVVVSPDNANSRDTATMTDDFVRLGFFHDITSPLQAWLPKWVKYHDSFK